MLRYIGKVGGGERDSVLGVDEGSVLLSSSKC